jgi:cytochrome P450 family 2 subfamily U polypeptide 1
MPIFKPFDQHKIDLVKKVGQNYRSILLREYMKKKANYSPDIVRDFADCVIKSKEEAEKEDSSIGEYLTDYNLMMIIHDLYAAGTDTTQTTLRWSILALINYPHIQDKIAKEITDNIGDRIPTQDDKKLLPYTYAFVMEVLRHWPPAPLGIDHLSAADGEIGGYKIPKNTAVYFNLYAINHDPKYWENPDKFDPTRFLTSDGELITTRFKSFVTFGIGPRGCIGEKLAYANAFLTIVRLVQKLQFQLPDGQKSSDLSPINIVLGLLPRDTPIVVKKRN